MVPLLDCCRETVTRQSVEIMAKFSVITAIPARHGTGPGSTRLAGGQLGLPRDWSDVMVAAGPDSRFWAHKVEPG